jgi:hypothetical protein
MVENVKRWLKKGYKVSIFTARLTHSRVESEQAITAIEKGRSEFFVARDGRQVPILIGLSASGVKYLKTDLDADGTDALLSLPDYNSRF